jgi:hypothetical protein
MGTRQGPRGVTKSIVSRRSEARSWGLEGRAVNSVGSPVGWRDLGLQNPACQCRIGCRCTFAARTPPPLSELRPFGWRVEPDSFGSRCSLLV